MPGPSPGRRRLAVRVVVGVACCGIVVAAGLAVAPVLLGKTEPPSYSRDAAVRAVDEARSADAARWAPERLRVAESALRASLAEARRQEVRAVPLRDFAQARGGFRLAEQLARRAAREAGRLRERARADAEEAVEAARGALDEATGVARATTADTALTSVARQASIHLDEATRLLGAGEFLASRDRAAVALAEASLVIDRAAGLASRYADEAEIRSWRRWAEEAVSWSRRTGGSSILVDKEGGTAHLYRAGRLLRSYPADMGSNTLSRKLSEGDAATPEGHYRIVSKKGPGESVYHRALLLDYPNAEDRRRFERARREGRVPAGSRLGGLIEIHGEGGRGKDWTRGCVALSNEDIDDLFGRVEIGSRVTIVGSLDGGGALSRLARRATEEPPE